VTSGSGGALREVAVERLPVPLGAFLKLAGAVRSGGEAKERIAGGQVRVNGEVERRRGRSLAAGDRVSLGSVDLRVRQGERG
jgi:ribosome-associated protein